MNPRITAGIASAMIVALAAVSANFTHASEPTLTPFKIVYAVRYSIGRGEMTLTMSRNSSGEYSLDAKVVARGIARAVMSDPAVQNATFIIKDNMVQGMGYSLNDGSDDNEHGATVEYDWDKGQASLSSKEDGNSTQPLAPGTMDDLSMQAAAALKAKLGEREFSLLELEPGKELRKHNFKFEGEETINTRVGEINTVKYSQQREGSSRTTYIWFSTDHDYAPVELERVRNGKTFSTLKLTTLEQ